MKRLNTLVAIGLTLLAGQRAGAEEPRFRSPVAVRVSPDGSRLFAVDRTAECVVVLDTASGKPTSEIALQGQPLAAVLAADGSRLFVAERTGHCVAEVDLSAGRVARRIGVGPWPSALAFSAKRQALFVCCRGDHSVVKVDLASGNVAGRIEVTRDPFAIALSPDEAKLLVANYMPSGAGTNPKLAAEVAVVDAEKLTLNGTVALPPGSTAVSGVAIGPEGRWGYAVHAIGRFMLPITQLDRGWVHTYALTIIDLNTAGRLATVLLDDVTGGAADPWDVAVSPDGETLVVSHAGIHAVSVVRLAQLHRLLAGDLPPALAQLKDGTAENIWVRIARDPSKRELLTNDLTALHLAEVIQRAPSGGLGPRGLALAGDGRQAFVCNYFSGTIGVIDLAAHRVKATIAVGEQPAASPTRRGEIFFHDANRCFQHWHSCFSCHLDDGRIDGLTWDFMRDGIGNGKDVISLIGMMDTAPHNRRATRPNPYECMRTGVLGSHFIVPQPGDVDDLVAYAASLRPEKNPLTDRNAEAVARGKPIFEGKAACAVCHEGPWLTDCKQHDVGTRTAQDPDGRYDTPSLVECYRTAPYLHDGRAATLREVFTKFNPDDRHGRTSQLTPAELDDLIAYLQSL